MKTENMKTGTVRTSKNGSDMRFDICAIEEWDAMTEDEQNEALVQAANESGVFEIFPNDN